MIFLLSFTQKLHPPSLFLLVNNDVLSHPFLLSVNAFAQCFVIDLLSVFVNENKIKENKINENEDKENKEV